MLLQDRPLWQANYKSMSAAQLVNELERIAKNPHHFDDGMKRKAFIADELAIKAHHTGPVILLEAE